MAAVPVAVPCRESGPHFSIHSVFTLQRKVRAILCCRQLRHHSIIDSFLPPDPARAPAAQRALLALHQRGVLGSDELQALLGTSQPTVSRLMAGLASQVIVLGAGRSTRYAAPQPILGLGAQHPIARVHDDGRNGQRCRSSSAIGSMCERAPST